MTTLPILDVEHYSSPRSPLLRYGGAVLILILLLLFRLVLSPAIVAESPYLALFLAVVLSAWYGGFGPGVLTTLVSAAAVATFITKPGSLFTVSEMVRIVFFLGQGFLVSYLLDALIHSRRRLADVLESISDGFCLLDGEWRFTYCNRRAADMARLQRKEIVGKSIWDLFPRAANTEFEHKLREAAVHRRPVNFEYLDPAWDTWYYFGAYPSREGLVLFSQDVTQLKRARAVTEEAKDKIERINVELEQRVDERTAEMNSTIGELEAFSYSISHDLRAPLRAIDGFSKMLHDDYYPKLDDEGRRLIEVIRNNTLNMGRLIDGLLAFSKLGRQAMGHAHVAMAELARDAVDEVRGSMNGRNIEFRLAELPDAEGDRVLLRQVLINLLSNAVKFTRGRDPAIIEVGSSPVHNQNIFYVRDNGVGFDSRYAGKMFGVFQRLHATTEFEGSGIGLAIVQRIVERHGGRVWAEGILDAGATLYFSLPAPEN